MPGAARHAGEIRGIGDAVQDLAAGKLMAGAPRQGNDEIADTSRVLDQAIAQLNRPCAPSWTP